ncbi:MAG: NAD(P)H-hydrate dehydratase [Pirellulales bacterium]
MTSGCRVVTRVPRLEPRPPESHKGDFGRAVLVGGSRGMSGAIALAGMAALRGGAGLVRLAVPDPCLDSVARFEPSYMTWPLPADARGRLTLAAWEPLQEALADATCVAVGPGLGRSNEIDGLVGQLYRHVARPLVVDADGLNALASSSEVWGANQGPRILTPHPGEFRRLFGAAARVREEQEEQAIEFARRVAAVVVLKGSRTLVTDGWRVYRNATGNPGMATGGSGDVLTGLITALVCQGLEPFDAAQLGVYLHGLAGDWAAAEVGQVSLIATDLIRCLSHAFLSYQRESADAGLST